MFTSQAFFLFVSVFLQVAKYSSGKQFSCTVDVKLHMLMCFESWIILIAYLAAKNVPRDRSKVLVSSEVFRHQYHFVETEICPLSAVIFHNFVEENTELLKGFSVFSLYKPECFDSAVWQTDIQT